jgi:ankyrin repeat protein
VIRLCQHQPDWERQHQRQGEASVVAELLNHGANATLVNSQPRSALMLAESEGHRAVVKLLVAK